MTVAVDSQEVGGVAHNSATSPLTWFFGNSGGTLLVVGVVVTQTLHGFGNLTINATYAGVAMTRGPNLNNWNGSENDYLIFFYLVNPATGTNQVSVTSTGAPFDIIGAAISFTGVNLALPLGSRFSATGTSATASVSVTGTKNGNYVLSLVGTSLAVNSATAPTILSALLNASISTQSDNFALGQQATFGGAVTPAFSVSSDPWGMIAVEVFAPLNLNLNLPSYLPPFQHYTEDWYTLRPQRGGPIQFGAFIPPSAPPPVNPNLLSNCITFNASNWNQSGGVAGTGPTFGSLVADPFGVVDAMQVTFSDPRCTFFQIPIPALTLNAHYTAQIWYKLVSGTPDFYMFYYNGANPVVQYSIKAVPTGSWQLLIFTLFTGLNGSLAGGATSATDPNPSVGIGNANVDGASQGNVGTVALW